MTFAVPTQVFVGPGPPGYLNVIADESGRVEQDAATSGALFMDHDVTLFGDGSIDTYVDHWTCSSDIATHGSVFASVPPTAGATVDTCPLTFTALVHDEGTVDAFSPRILFDIYGSQSGDWFGWYSYVYGFGIELPSSDQIHTITGATFVPNSDDPYNPKTVDDMSTAMQTEGIDINFSAFTGSTTGVIRQLRVHELSFGDYDLLSAELSADIDKVEAFFPVARRSS